MLLFDAHAHLAAPDFADDLSDVLTRAESAGLCGVLTVGETLADAERILDLAAGHRLIKPAAGLFPTILDPAAAAAVLAFVRRNADRLDLALNIHSRSAGRHTIAFLRRCGARRVLMHAFDGRAASAVEGAEAGYAFSIPPSVVRSPQKQKLVRRLQLECLLLETDSPVLGPDPATRNEPANVVVACRAVAELKGVPPDKVARVTTDNARRLFPRAFA